MAHLWRVTRAAAAGAENGADEPAWTASPALRMRLRKLAAGLARLLAVAVVFCAGALTGAAAMYELATSALQARVLSLAASRLTFEMKDGPSGQAPPPAAGPFDVRRGYSRAAEFTDRLTSGGFRVTRQARVSPALAWAASHGIAPPYREPAIVGLQVRGTDGSVLHDRTDPRRSFARFEDIPPVVVRALLFIENRQLLEPIDARSNPSVEWDRMVRAGFLYTGSKLGLRLPVEGGSTLAVQMEKFRHSPDGITHTPLDKLRQIAGASLKSYRYGPDTRAVRREFVVDYLNTMPLAAAPGFGEVHGLGEGLYAWFGLDLDDVRRALAAPGLESARALKHTLALLAAVRAPTFYLRNSREALEARIEAYLGLMADAGIVDPELAVAARGIRLEVVSRPVVPPPDGSFVDRKAVNAVRAQLLDTLGLQNLDELEHLHLAAESAIDPPLQNEATRLLRRLADPTFVAASGLNGERLLEGADPDKVLYSLMLFERTDRGNLLRVQADSLDQPLDINTGTKMELGSTAKLRTLAHYLELVAGLHRELAPLEAAALRERAKTARDPITGWAAQTLLAEPDTSIDGMLQKALDRRYSANPGEAFFTGGGVHYFVNFDRDDNGRVLTVREGLRRSVNLVFIRLMRDLVRFHRARLPYDADAVLEDPQHPVRLRLLREIADEEASGFLQRAYRRYRGKSQAEILADLLGKRADSARALAILYYAWHEERTPQGLAVWLRERLGTTTDDEVRRLVHAYGNPWLGLADYGYLLRTHPLEVWCAGRLFRAPELGWDEVLATSGEAREVSSRWLFATRNRRAQDLRLRIRTEGDAFARMAPAWKRLGFPFDSLVPTYATAIGSSGDRPAALADLMGIIVNDGARLPMMRLTKVHFAEGTPYETEFEPVTTVEQVLDPAVARALRGVLAEVVEAGTGRRVAGAFRRADGSPVTVGGKTGSGDNRFETFNRHGGVTSSRAINRTATFVFYVGDRYFGVLTAHVPGREAAAYGFTSALPASVLKLLAPAINARL